MRSPTVSEESFPHRKAQKLKYWKKFFVNFFSTEISSRILGKSHCAKKSNMPSYARETLGFCLKSEVGTSVFESLDETTHSAQKPKAGPSCLPLLFCKHQIQFSGRLEPKYLCFSPGLENLSLPLN